MFYSFSLSQVTSIYKHVFYYINNHFVFANYDKGQSHVVITKFTLFLCNKCHCVSHTKNSNKELPLSLLINACHDKQQVIR